MRNLLKLFVGLSVSALITTSAATVAAAPKVGSAVLRINVVGLSGQYVNHAAVGERFNFGCSTVCDFDVSIGQKLFLEPLYGDATTTFVGWSSPPCPSVSDCLITINGDTQVTATFAPVTTQPLTIYADNLASFPGGIHNYPIFLGNGSITSTATAPCVVPNNPDGGEAVCIASVPTFSTVSLAAIPATATDIFLGWGMYSNSDCISPNILCTVTMDGPHDVSGSFAPNFALVDFNCGTQTSGGVPTFCHDDSARIAVSSPSLGTGEAPIFPCGEIGEGCGTAGGRVPIGESVTFTLVLPPDAQYQWSGACANLTTASCTLTPTTGLRAQVSVLDGYPSPPQSVAAAPLDGAATVAFLPPTLPGPTGIDSYTVTSIPDGLTATGTTSPITISGLTNNVAYRFTVTATNPYGTSRASSLSNSVTPVPAPTSFTVPWDANDEGRLQQIAAYLGVSPATVQQQAVFLVGFLIGLVPSNTPTPATLPPPGNAASHTTTWNSTDLSVLNSVKTRFVVDDIDAHRFSVYLLSFLLGLGGH